MNKVWICPASPENIHVSLDHETVLPQGSTGYLWAFNSRRTKSFELIEEGDLCIFINIRHGQTQCRVANVVDKFIIDHVNDNWPFRSPSGAPWTLAFQLSKPVERNITYQHLRELWGNKNQIWQTQTLVSDPNVAQQIRYAVSGY